MLVKRRAGSAQRSSLASTLSTAVANATGQMDRRSFLRNSGLAAGGMAALGALPLATVKKAEAGPVDPDIEVTRRKSICTHCSVGCTVIAEVQNGVWTGQEPGWDSPISQGTHCAKGASVRELTKGERRNKYPVKLENGEWKRITWDQAIEEIGNKLLEIREKSGPDSVFWLGSAKFSNEGAYLYRKFAAMWGTNTVDHQARICHSTTVAGVANTWGYGAMTNSYNDLQNAHALMIIGGNPAEAHPVSMQHMLRAKEHNRAPLIVVDPRFTRTAAHATDYIRIRPGTDIPLIWGLLWHVFENGWEDKEFIRQRVYGMDEIRAEVAKWNPEECERVTGVPGEQLRKAAETMAKNKPSTLIWCMGATQKTVGTANVRAFSIFQLALGNIGVEGGGANIYRGHSNVQGATDMGLDVTSLPSYYGLAEGAWRHWARVWEVDYDWLKGRFASKELMETKGVPTTRWFDAVLAKPGELDQPNNIKAFVTFGHGGNTVTRMPEMRRGLEALELMVVVDPHPTTFASVSGQQERHLYPAGLHPVRAVRLPCGVQPVASVVRSGGRADLRVQGRLRDHVSAGPQAGLRGSALQEHHGRWHQAARRGHPAGDQPGEPFDRLHRPVAGAAEDAHGVSGRLRQDLHARNQGAVQGRILWSALAVLGNAGDEASRLGCSLRYLQACHGRRLHFPCPLRDRAERRQPAGRRLLQQGIGDHRRLPRVHHGGAEEAGLGRRPDARRDGGYQQDRRRQRRSGELDDRPVLWHHPGCSEARLRAPRQRQGAGGGLEPARPGADPSRAALYAPARSGGKVPRDGRPPRLPHDAARQERMAHRELRCQVDPGKPRRRGDRSRLPRRHRSRPGQAAGRRGARGLGPSCPPARAMAGWTSGSTTRDRSTCSK